jgi:ubiquinone/menaquinone biosynthesis C-methylase UbiE
MATSVACAQDEDTNWLIENLNIEKGTNVAEIGAGNGRLTLQVARHVGSSGQIYSSELSADSVEYLRDVVESDPVSNVKVIKGHPTRTNFPKECCDALFMRRVYHHFDDPVAMNKSIWQSLKPGGRVAIIDFSPSGGEQGDPEERDCSSFEHHGVTKETVVDEFQEAGFKLVSSEERSGGDIYVVMQKRESGN